MVGSDLVMLDVYYPLGSKGPVINYREGGLKNGRFMDTILFAQPPQLYTINDPPANTQRKYHVVQRC